MRSNAPMHSPVDLMQHVYRASVLRGRWFRKPEDTWTPALFHLDSNGEIFVTGMHPPTESTKTHVALGIQSALITTGSVEALLVAPALEASVNTAIAAAADGTVPAVSSGGNLFAPCGEAVEVLLFLHVGGSFALIRSAPVVRRPNTPPTLGPLSEIRGEGLEVSGLLTDAIRRGIG